ncbi:MAG: HEAT repeat domain-containing protein [Planctomycetes bacterium]|nr:HEAT repeat domain-containing protein [Planctomycetota bacterium]
MTILNPVARLSGKIVGAACSARANVVEGCHYRLVEIAYCSGKGTRIAVSCIPFYSHFSRYKTARSLDRAKKEEVESSIKTPIPEETNEAPVVADSASESSVQESTQAIVESEELNRSTECDQTSSEDNSQPSQNEDSPTLVYEEDTSGAELPLEVDNAAEDQNSSESMVNSPSHEQDDPAVEDSNTLSHDAPSSEPPSSDALIPSESISPESAPSKPEPSLEVKDVSREDIDAAEFSSAVEKAVVMRGLAELNSAFEQTRISGIQSLGSVPHTLSVQALTRCYQQEEKSFLRANCIEALTKLQLDICLPVLKKALSDEAAEVRLIAVRGVYRLGHIEGAVDSVIEMFNDESEEVRHRAIVCAGWMNNPQLTEHILAHLGDANSSIRRAVIESLMILGGEECIEPLIESLVDTDVSVRKVAHQALQKITGKEMRDVKLSADSERVRARWHAWWQFACERKTKERA